MSMFNYSTQHAGAWLLRHLKQVKTPQSATEIAIATGQWRTNVYKTVKLLVQRGVVAKTDDKKYYLRGEGK